MTLDSLDLGSFFKIIFIDWYERERNTDLLFHSLMHSLVDSHVLWPGIEPASLAFRMTLNNWATWPGLLVFLSLLSFVLSRPITVLSTSSSFSDLLPLICWEKVLDKDISLFLLCSSALLLTGACRPAVSAHLIRNAESRASRQISWIRINVVTRFSGDSWAH